MQFYFAPMEGITNYAYRQEHNRFFGGCHKYFTFFITPTGAQLKGRGLREILPENNGGLAVVPQFLTDKADGFLALAQSAADLGYNEVNLNLGCPSGTVVSKGRGAGFLGRPDDLHRFLDAVFASAPIRVSIKTRIGMESAEEFGDLLAIFNEYPIHELIVHPRVRSQFYRGLPDLDAFAQALAESRAPVVYNGNVFTQHDFNDLTRRFPTLQQVMLGRGLVANPALARPLAGGAGLTKEQLADFHRAVLDYTRRSVSGEKDVVYRMKEQWNYWSHLFDDHKKPLKAIRKATRLDAYLEGVEAMFGQALFDPQKGFDPNAL